MDNVMIVVKKVIRRINQKLLTHGRRQVALQVKDGDAYFEEVHGYLRAAQTTAFVRNGIVLFGPRRIVDLGCGLAPVRGSLEESGVSAVGFEASRSAIRRVSARIPAFFADLTVPFVTNHTFDVAICTEVADHRPRSALLGPSFRRSHSSRIASSFVRRNPGRGC